MSFNSQQVSNIDLGLPLEAQVLSQFFDQDFVPTDYINALINASLNNNSNSNNANNSPQALNNKSTQLNSASSLKILFRRCSALSLHFNEYTNELCKRFDRSYEKLHTASSQIISYDSQFQLGPANNFEDDIDGDLEDDTKNSSKKDGTDSNKEIVTRLQYHLATLNTSMYSLLDDLEHTRTKLDSIDPSKRDTQEIDELQTLVMIKNRVEEVKASFNLLKSLVASSEIENSSDVVNNITVKKITVHEFKNALNVLTDLMKDQITQEMELYNTAVENGSDIEINEKLIKIINNMINLQPIFKSLVHFQAPYATFVAFLKQQKSNYLDLFNEK